MRIDITGEKFGMLFVTTMLPDYKCACDCDCGARGVIKFCHGLTSGKTKSCGCAKGRMISERRATHGDSRVGAIAPEYRAWRSMLQRCLDPKYKKFHMWGGRGITIHDEWIASYPSFLAYVGRRPTAGHSIDRFPNMNGNYEPGNVRWANRKDQARNTRTCRFITVGDKRATVAEWSEMSGQKARLISKRLSLGWSPSDAISVPVESTEERKIRATVQAKQANGRIGVNANRAS